MSRNFRILGIGLIGLGTVFVTLILGQMWFSLFDTEIFVRLLITLGLAGLYGLYIGMIWDDLEKSRYRKMLLSLGGFGLIAVLLILGQVWFEFLEGEIFVKLLISVTIVSALTSFIMAVREDFLESKHLKDENFLD
jgi:hypothetical protein